MFSFAFKKNKVNRIYFIPLKGEIDSRSFDLEMRLDDIVDNSEEVIRANCALNIKMADNFHWQETKSIFIRKFLCIVEKQCEYVAPSLNT